MPIKYNATISGAKLQELEVSNAIPGLSAFWHFVRGLLSRQKDSALVFKPMMGKNLGGFLTLRSNCNFVCLRKKYLKDGKLHFKKMEDVAIFIHELCHWIHFNYLDYKYSSGNPQAGKNVSDLTSNVERFYIELEAWNLSRKFGKLYKFSTELLTEIDKGNSKNMQSVLKQNNNADSPFCGKKKIKKNYSELTFEDYVLDDQGVFHLPLL